MAIDYTKWPNEADVAERCQSAGIVLRSQGRITSALNGVIRSIATQTRRQFVPGAAGETRYYDGSGGVELEIPDEIITLTGATILSVVGVLLPFVVTSPYLIQEQTLARNRILLYQGTAPIFAGTYLNQWPQGYKNCGITGTFGYEATIPADLWDAVCGQAAAALVTEARSGARGLITEKREGDNMTKWQIDDIAGEWRKEFRRAVKFYTRPLGQRIRRQRSPIG